MAGDRVALQRLLDEHGLGEHAAVLESNGVDVDVLSELTDHDLRELGIAVGDRRRMLRSFARFTSEVPEDDRSDDVSGDRSDAVRAPERRQLTVMFVDLVASTELSERLDPEEMSEVLRAYHNAVTIEIRRIDGFTAKLMGDGVLAYFGWPYAHEDEAERAIRAGLAICEAVGELRSPSGEALQARVGIATGLVVVGDLIGEGAAQEEAVVGDTPNLAARLQGLAQPGAVVIAETTRVLAGDIVDVTDLGEHELKGIRGAVPAFAVNGMRTFATRFASRSGRRLHSLVGRRAELDLLIEHWNGARAGTGKAVFVSGKAGIGKSRLVEELFVAVSTKPHTRILHQCSPYHADSALQPVIDHLRRAAGLQPDESPDVTLDKIERLLRPIVPTQTPASLIARLLDVDGTDRYGELTLSPQQLRHQTIETLIELWTGLARETPVLWVIEDLHWVDPTTLQLLETSLDRVPTERVLIVVTARPEFEPAVREHRSVEELTLDRLDHDEVAQVANRVTGSKRLPNEVLDQIFPRTDGIPLYVEETTKAIVESGVLDEGDDAYTLLTTVAAMAVPSSLSDSLLSRLDRLGPAKSVAQTASVIGRSFDRPTLAALSDESSGNIDDALDRLVDSEVVFRSETASLTTYRFQHSLVRDIAYKSLLRSTRTRLHGRLAAMLDNTVDPERVAHHQRHAGLLAEAADTYLVAADRSMRTGAYVEAAHAHRSAAEVLEASGRDDERRLRVQLGLGSSATALHGWADSRTNEAYESARALATRLGNREAQVMSLTALAISHGDRGAPQVGIERAEEILALESPSRLHQFMGHAAMVMPAHFHGEFARSRDHASLALAIHDESMDQHLHELGGPYIPTLCRIYSGWNSWFLGDDDASNRWIDNAIAAVPESRQPFNHCYALLFGTILAFWRGDLAAQLAFGERTLEVGNRYRFGFFAGIGQVFVAHGRAQTVPGPERIAEVEAGLAMASSEDHRSGIPTILDLISSMQQQLGDIDTAAQTIAEAQELAAATHQHNWEAELHRRHGEFAELRGDAVEAERSYRKAIEVAEALGAVPLKARATANLASLNLEART